MDSFLNGFANRGLRIHRHPWLKDFAVENVATVFLWTCFLLSCVVYYSKKTHRAGRNINLNLRGRAVGGDFFKRGPFRVQRRRRLDLVNLPGLRVGDVEVKGIVGRPCPGRFEHGGEFKVEKKSASR